MLSRDLISSDARPLLKLPGQCHRPASHRAEAVGRSSASIFLPPAHEIEGRNARGSALQLYSCSAADLTSGPELLASEQSESTALGGRPFLTQAVAECQDLLLSLSQLSRS